MFRSFNVRPEMQLLRNFNETARSPLGQYIHSISIIESDRPRNTYANSENRASSSRLAKVPSLFLAAVQNLKQLEEVRVGEAFKGSTFTLFPALIRAWICAMATILMPKLTRLDLRNRLLDEVLAQSLLASEGLETTGTCLRQTILKIRDMSWTSVKGHSVIGQERLVEDTVSSNLFAIRNLKIWGEGEGNYSALGYTLLASSVDLQALDIHDLSTTFGISMSLISQNQSSLKSLKLKSVGLSEGLWQVFFIALEENCLFLRELQVDDLGYRSCDTWFPPRVLEAKDCEGSDMPGMTRDDNRALQSLRRELMVRQRADHRELCIALLQRLKPSKFALCAHQKG